MGDNEIDNIVVGSLAVVVIIKIIINRIFNLIIKDTKKSDIASLLNSIIFLTIWILFINNYIEYHIIIIISSIWIMDILANLKDLLKLIYDANK
jgi:hypothetical protein